MPEPAYAAKCADDLREYGRAELVGDISVDRDNGAKAKKGGVRCRMGRTDLARGVGAG